MREDTPMTRAIDEHLRLALPGWGAPGGRFVDRPTVRVGEARSKTRIYVERELIKESPFVLQSILVEDVRKKFNVHYATAHRALHAALRKTRSLAA